MHRLIAQSSQGDLFPDSVTLMISDSRHGDPTTTSVLAIVFAIVVIYAVSRVMRRAFVLMSDLLGVASEVMAQFVAVAMMAVILMTAFAVIVLNQ